jgi:hypothetical protein
VGGGQKIRRAEVDGCVSPEGAEARIRRPFRFKGSGCGWGSEKIGGLKDAVAEDPPLAELQPTDKDPPYYNGEEGLPITLQRRAFLLDLQRLE